MKWLKKMENIFSAVAFAEAGEFETARQMAKEDNETRKETACKTESHRSDDRTDATHYSYRA